MLIFTVIHHAVATCKLPSDVCAIDIERRAYHQQPAQEIKASLCAGHTAIHVLAR